MTYIEQQLKMARQLGALTGAAQVTIDFLEASDPLYDRALITWMLKRALAHDGSPDYYNRYDAAKPSHTTEPSDV